MKRYVPWIFLMLPIACFGADRFVLQSELRTNYLEGATSASFTGYTYDADGNRVLKRVYDGVDSAAPLMSRELFEYDAEGRVVRNTLISAAGDTLSVVSNLYGPDGLASASTFNKDGTVRFKDSLIYSAGLLVEQRRYNASAAMTFFHRYGYASGLLASDSLYEADGAGGFAAAAVRIVSRNADSTVSQEAQWRKSGGSWYPVGTTKMRYEQKRLVSVAVYETDGSAGRLVDSLAYAYDDSGNRIRETGFNDERIKEYDIVFTWRDTQGVSVAFAGGRGIAQQAVTFRNGALRFAAPFTGTVTLFTVSGVRTGSFRIDHHTIAPLPIRPAQGRYIAQIRGTVNQSLSFFVNN